MWLRSIVIAAVIGLSSIEDLAAENPDLSNAVEKIKAMGGDLRVIDRDRSSDRLVKEILFSRNHRIRNDHVRLLQSLPDLTFLQIGIVISEASGFRLGDRVEVPEEDEVAALSADEVKQLEMENVRRASFDSGTIDASRGKEIGQLKSLETLSLGRALVDDESLAGLYGLTNLKMFILQDVQISDAGLKGIGKLKSLETLDLMAKGITDKSVNELSQLSNLKWLSVRHTQITDKGIEELKKALPNTSIHR